MSKQLSSSTKWEDPNFTMMRTFNFENPSDIEILIEVVKEKFPDRPSKQRLRSRLLGILRSQYSLSSRRLHLQHQYPITWKLELALWKFKRFLHRSLRTPYYKKQVHLCELSNEVIAETKRGS
ncbi:hypothetical protein OAH77_04385 [Flavobacteriaceae bacterium]|nr:hypothetical protein [Flavobacteriaceae bacterium]